MRIRIEGKSICGDRLFIWEMNLLLPEQPPVPPHI
jgi:hypothetical protein